jgi:hypothetical protein
MNSKEGRSLVQLAILVGLTLFAFESVLAQDVTYNSAPGADFTKFKTYKWVKIEGAEYPDQILDQQATHSVDLQLAAKGLTKIDRDTADLFVAYQVSISQEKQWDACVAVSSKASSFCFRQRNRCSAGIKIALEKKKF